MTGVKLSRVNITKVFGYIKYSYPSKITIAPCYFKVHYSDIVKFACVTGVEKGERGTGGGGIRAKRYFANSLIPPNNLNYHEHFQQVFKK